jgi:hypothetical protein
VLLALTLGATGARAADLTVTQFHPTLPLSAEVTFSNQSGSLVITLTNIEPSDVVDPAEILTAFYFDSSTALTLTKVSAKDANPAMLMFGPGSSGMSHDPMPDGVGGEWSYWEGLTNAPFGQDYAINSAGLGLLGTMDGVFPGANLDGPTMVDGVNYGISTATDNPATGNAPVTGGGGPLIRNRVVFTLSGLPLNYDPSTQISNVQFQYGTTRCDVPGSVDRCIPDVPEPATVGLIGLGLAALLRRKR